MLFPRWTFRLAGSYGLIVLVPQYFLADYIGRTEPPPIIHPEFFYGFVGVAIAWQLAFLIIAQDPARYRPLMLAAIVEKATFSLATFLLFAQQRLSINMLIAGSIDFVLGVLFAIAWLRTAPMHNPNS